MPRTEAFVMYEVFELDKWKAASARTSEHTFLKDRWYQNYKRWILACIVFELFESFGNGQGLTRLSCEAVDAGYDLDGKAYCENFDDSNGLTPFHRCEIDTAALRPREAVRAEEHATCASMQRCDFCLAKAGCMGMEKSRSSKLTPHILKHEST
jgi:hypothetical protein